MTHKASGVRGARLPTHRMLTDERRKAHPLAELRSYMERAPQVIARGVNSACLGRAAADTAGLCPGVRQPDHQCRRQTSTSTTWPTTVRCCSGACRARWFTRSATSSPQAFCSADSTGQRPSSSSGWCRARNWSCPACLSSLGAPVRLPVQLQGVFADYEKAQLMEHYRPGKAHSARTGSVNGLSCVRSATVTSARTSARKPL